MEGPRNDRWELFFLKWRKTSKIRRINPSTISMEWYGVKYEEKLLDGELRWDDGDIWHKTEARVLHLAR